MEEGECPLCLEECSVGTFEDTWGDKYDCPRCFRFVLDKSANWKVKRLLRDQAVARTMLRDYVKNHQEEGKFLTLSWSDIEIILKDAGLKVEGLFK